MHYSAVPDKAVNEKNVSAGGGLTRNLVLNEQLFVQQELQKPPGNLARKHNKVEHQAGKTMWAD